MSELFPDLNFIFRFDFNFDIDPYDLRSFVSKIAMLFMNIVRFHLRFSCCFDRLDSCCGWADPFCSLRFIMYLQCTSHIMSLCTFNFNVP